MKFSSILKKINFKSRKSMLKTGAILFWTDMKRLFNWNIDNFKSNFLSRGQLGSKSNDKFFLSVLKMWQCCKYFFGNLIFALTARTLSGNRLKLFKISTIDPYLTSVLTLIHLPLNPLSHNSDKDLFSPYSITTRSNIQVMRINKCSLKMRCLDE